MAKSFKKFRQDWDDEWGNEDEDERRKSDKMKNRRDMRRKKSSESMHRLMNVLMTMND